MVEVSHDQVITGSMGGRARWVCLVELIPGPYHVAEALRFLPWMAVQEPSAYLPTCLLEYLLEEVGRIKKQEPPGGGWGTIH